MDFGLKGKVVIVTGGSSGIGFAIAKAFLAEGAVVVTNGRDEAKLKDACIRLGASTHGIVADLSTEQGAATLFEHAKMFGPVDYLINNIGRFDVEDFFEISDARWHEYFDENLLTGIRITRPVMKDMLSRNSGSIVFISSEAAIRSLPHMIHYSTTKTAQLGLARGLAELTRGTNVRVNAYMPGTTATESVQGYFEGVAKARSMTVDEVLANFFKNDQPGSLIQKLIDPAMHGRAVVQLATNTAQNGTAMRTDGGAVHSII